MILAIDGGKHSPGLAWFDEDDGEFYSLGPDIPSHHVVTTIVYERPVYYPNDPPGKVSALITLSIATGRLVERYARDGTRIEEVEARTWKGNVPKSITRRRVLKRLSRAEKSRLESDLSTLSPKAQIDHYDAVGIGLWWLEKEGLR